MSKKVTIQVDADLLPELYQAIKTRSGDLETLCAAAYDEDLKIRTATLINRLKSLGEEVINATT